MLSLDLVNQFYNYKWWKLFLFLPLKSQVVWESRETDRICLRTARAHWNKSPSISAKPWFVLFKHFPNPDLSSSIIPNALICPLQLHQMLWFVIFNYLNSADLSCSIIWYAPSSPLKLSQMVWFALFYYLKWYIFFQLSHIAWFVLVHHFKCSGLSSSIISSKMLTFSLIASRKLHSYFSRAEQLYFSLWVS